MKTSHVLENILVKGDLVRFKLGRPDGPADPGLGIYLGPYTSTSVKSGEVYVCAEVLWLKDNRISTAAFCVLNIVRGAA